MKFKVAFKNLQFVPRRKQIIYVESSYHENVNGFIQRNYKKILHKCNFMGIDFCYIPKMAEELGASNVLTGYLYDSEEEKEYIEVINDDGDTITVNREIWV